MSLFLSVNRNETKKKERKKRGGVRDESAAGCSRESSVIQQVAEIENTDGKNV